MESTEQILFSRVGLYRPADGGRGRIQRIAGHRSRYRSAGRGYRQPGRDSHCRTGIAGGSPRSRAGGTVQAATKPVASGVYLIVVPTPFKGNHEPDVSYVEAATRSVVPLLKAGDLFIIESTSPVGTTDRMTRLIFSERPEPKGNCTSPTVRSGCCRATCCTSWCTTTG